MIAFTSEIGTKQTYKWLSGMSAIERTGVTPTPALFIFERIWVPRIHDNSSDNRNFLLDGSRFEQLKLLGNLHHLYERA